MGIATNLTTMAERSVKLRLKRGTLTRAIHVEY